MSNNKKNETNKAAAAANATEQGVIAFNPAMFAGMNEEALAQAFALLKTQAGVVAKAENAIAEQLKTLEAEKAAILAKIEPLNKELAEVAIKINTLTGRKAKSTGGNGSHTRTDKPKECCKADDGVSPRYRGHAKTCSNYAATGATATA